MKKLFFPLIFIFLLFSCSFEPENNRIPINSLNFQQTSAAMKIGESKTVYVEYQPQEATDVKIDYSCSTDGIIEISGQSKKACVITAVSPGSTILIAKCDGFTSYCEIKVEDVSLNIDPYIVLPYVSMELERGRRKTIIASLFGGSASDNSQFEWKTNSNIISISGVSNSCVVEAKKPGVARVTAHHPKSQYDTSFIVYVPEDKKDLFYLTTQSNVIKTYCDTQTNTNLTVSIVGGTESDNALVVFDVIEGKDNISIRGNNNVCTITGLKSGKSIIEVSHIKAEEPLYITVVVAQSTDVNYITTNNDFLLLNGIESVDIIATMVGDYGSDVNSRYTFTIEDPSVIEVVQANNNFHVTSKKDGRSKLVINNFYSDYKKEVQFIVENTQLKSSECYISVDKPIIQLEKGGKDVSVKVKLIGGNESDKNNFSYTVEDSSIVDLTVADGQVMKVARNVIVETPDVYETEVLITPKNCGITKIKVSNPKTDIDGFITVKVFPKGTFNESDVYISGSSLVKLLVGETHNFTCSLSENGSGVTSLNWECKDNNILDITANGTEAVFIAKGKGITNVKVSSPNVRNTLNCTVIVAESQAELDSSNVIYVDNTYPEVELGSESFFELKTLLNVDYTKYKVSVNDINVAKARISGNTLILNAVGEGNTEVIITNDEIPSYNLVIYVKVINSNISIDYPYTLSGMDFVNVLIGKSFTFPISLGNAPESEYSDIDFETEDKNICSINLNSHNVTVNGLVSGQTRIGFRHPKCRTPKLIYVNVAATEQELNSKVVLFAEKTNYVTTVGDKLSLSVICNRPEEIQNLIWSVSDTSMLDIDVSAGSAFVTPKKAGFAEIKVSHGSGFELKFFLTIKEELQNNTDPVIKLPSIIELITEKSSVLKIEAENVNEALLSDTKWESDSSILTVKGNGRECYLMPNSKGCCNISVTNAKLNLKKNIVVNICDRIDDFDKSYTISTADSVYNINKHEILDISLIFGKNELPDYYYEDFVWKNDNKDIVSITPNGKNVSIKGLEAGAATVHVSNKHCANEYSFVINVNSTDSQSNYSFVTNKIIKMQNGDTGTYKFSVINSLDNTDVTPIAEVSVSSLSNDNIELSLVSNILRIKALKNGSTIVKLFSNRYQIETSFIVHVNAAGEDGSDSFIVTTEYDHYLLKTDEVIDIKLITESEDAQAINEMVWALDDNSVAGLEVAEDNKSCRLTAKKGGSCVLSVISRNYTHKIYISVTDFVTSHEENYKTESIINMVKGTTYNSKIIGNNYINLSSYDNSVVEVQLYENNLTINGLNKGSTEIYLGKNNQYAILVNVFETQQELDLYECFNIDKRYYNLDIGESKTISPLYVPSGDKKRGTVYEDVYSNNVVEILNKEGSLYVTGKNPGIAKIKVSNNLLNSFYIYVEVSENLLPGTPEENTNFFLYTTTNPVYLDSINKEATLITYVSGEGDFLGNTDYVWSCSDEELLNINPSLNACTISAKKAVGECFISCSNIYANNVLNYKVIVGSGYINNGVTTKYVSCSKNTVSMTYDSGVQIVNVALNNMESSSLKDIKLSNNKSNIVETSYYIEGNKYFIELKPLSCGSGRITISHPEAEVNSYVDYIVNDNDSSEIVYLTSSDNFSFVRPGEYKTISAELKNYDEINSDNYKWTNNTPDVCSIFGNGPQVEVYGIKEGNGEIQLKHPKSNNTLTFKITVSANNKDVKYITTSSNIIETQVSQFMDSFNVSMVGDSSIDSSFEYKVSDPSVLSVVGNNNTCYYRGLKAGSAQITISNKADINIMPITVNVIVSEVNKSEGFITSDSNINYLPPFGNSKTVNISLENVPNADKTKLNWYIYSQTLATNAQGNVIELTASGTRGVIRPKNEGIAKIRVVYTPLNLKLNIMVYVSAYGKIEFVKDSLTMFVGETQFANINVPTFSDNMTDFITYSCDNPTVCSAYGSSKVACITALKEGTSIVKAKNTYDDSTSELVVRVIDEKAGNFPRIDVSQSCFLLNPRSDNQTLFAYLSGSGTTEDDQAELTWSITGNPSVTIYPNKGPEARLSLKKVNGVVQEGIATINITHPKCPEGYNKSIFVSVEELQNYFTLDTYSATLDTDASVVISADIVGASAADMEEIQWSVDNKKIESDGTVTDIARVMNSTGGSCTVLGISEGICTVTAFYHGTIQQCIISVKGDRYFSVVNNSLMLYPGQEYTLQYNLRPSTYVPSWYSSDENNEVIEFTPNHDSQTVFIKAKTQGNATLTGMVPGIGTVICNIKVVYNPRLIDKSKTAGSVFIPLYDKGTKEFEETQNSKTIDFLCYPPIYYVKATVESDLGFEEKVNVSLVQNHNREDLDPKAGLGTLTFHINGELPNDDIRVTLQQYEDKDCRKPIDENKLTFKINSYYVDSNGKRDSGFELYFKRNDGSFTLNRQQPNKEDMILLFDSDNGRVTPEGAFTTNKIVWGESESHFLIFRPKHEGQYFENLEISTTSESIGKDETCEKSCTDIGLKASRFNYEKNNYVSIVNTGINCDVGYDVMYSPENNNLTVPRSSSSKFYSRFAVRKPRWNNMEPLGKNQRFPSSINAGYYNGNWISFSGNTLSTGPNSGWGSDFDDKDWSRTLFCLEDHDSWFGADERSFYYESDSLSSRSNLPLAAYVWTDNIKKAFYNERAFDFAVHNGKRDYGFCEHWYLFVRTYHWYWKNNTHNYRVNVHLDKDFTIFTERTFPYKFSLFNMWKDAGWIDSYNGKCLPNNNTSPLGNVSLNGEISIAFNDVNGKRHNLVIPNEIRIYDCYRRYYKYDIRTNVFSNEVDEFAANPKFIKIK